MAGYGDMLGDELMQHQEIESLRSGEIGEPVVLHIRAATNFFDQLRVFVRPYDARLADALEAAAAAVLDEMKGVFAHVWEGQVSFVFWNPTETIACGCRFQELATFAVSVFTETFNRVGMDLFPDAYEKAAGRFAATSHGLPSLETASRYFDWREREARVSSLNYVARATLGGRKVDGRSRQDLKDMLMELGLDFDAYYPERFQRGSFLRRMRYERYLTDEEMARIPEDRRPDGPVTRTGARVLEDVPPLALIENLAGFVFHNEPPVVLDLPFAASVAL